LPATEVTLALEYPARFTWQKKDDSGEGEGWNFVTSDHKEKYVTFDTNVVKAFDTHGEELIGKDHAYLVQTSDNGKAPQVVGIPGVWVKQKKGGGYGGAKTMFTDRQVALLAASVFPGQHDVLETAGRYAAWLGMSSKDDSARSPSKASEKPQGARSRSASPAPVEVPDDEVRQRELAQICRKLVLGVCRGDATAARDWLIERFGDGFERLEDVHQQDLEALRVELEKAVERVARERTSEPAPA
jgi:hypothetical protein